MKNNFTNFIIYGKALAFYREKAALKQEEIANLLEKNRVTINGWEQKEKIKVTEDQMNVLTNALKVTTDELTRPPAQETKKPDILDHPVIKSLVAQSDYIMGRVRELEEENRLLRAKQKN